MKDSIRKSFLFCMGLFLLMAVFVVSMPGCAYKSSPQASVTVLNNTVAYLDIECNGQLVRKDLEPGKTFLINIYRFTGGQQIPIIATGYDVPEGKKDEERRYLGASTFHFRIPYDRHGYSHGYSYRNQYEHEVWEVVRLGSPGGSQRHRW